MQGLETADGVLGKRAMPTIDRAGRKARARKTSLERPHELGATRLITRADSQRQVSRVQRRPRLRTDNAVDAQAAGGLKVQDRKFSERAIPAVDRARRKARVSQAMLDHLHQHRAVRTAVASVRHDQNRVAGSAARR